MIDISAVLIPLEGTFAKLTGTTIVVPLPPETEPTLTVNPVAACVISTCINVNKRNTHNAKEINFVTFDLNINHPPQIIKIYIYLKP